ncbi:hypothetical protein QUC31_004308 [Theobroma cacao]|uniref:P-loop containing nucleoside triphosphate hydrolases superfamily protein, putative n=1 Tax=Theobroma cacao TaxID=3641 RepID=A0A061DLY3_THECC|nr:P-loop containing nucleoside triphosphate hydrolases superfamily protein, putative [Theobroma cacao]
MGGETMTPPNFTSEDEPSVDQDFPLPSLFSQNPTLVRDDLGMKVDHGKKEVDRLLCEEFGQLAPQFSSYSLEFEADDKRRHNVYKEVLHSYCQLQVRSMSLNEVKSKVLSYVPGAWIENVGGMKSSDYDVPKTTALLLIGPKGCGKSSLVNKISRVFEDDKFAPARAQVSFNLSVGDGTCYLQEYTIPRGSASFCLYDSRSLCNDTSDNINMIKCWMTKGVRHEELVVRKSHQSSLRRRMKCKTRERSWKSCETRTVNFVIFVVDGITVLKSMEGDGPDETQYMEMITRAFMCPYLSFKDDKPAVVITHGDLLSLADRARVRVHLGELLGIPPAKQIFDIPESDDPATALTIVDMLRYSLEHADRNLPRKNWVYKVFLSACTYLLAMLGIAIVAAYVKHLKMRHAHKSEFHIDWRAIRHMWLED